jgi:hypothetical protein
MSKNIIYLIDYTFLSHFFKFLCIFKCLITISDVFKSFRDSQGLYKNTY